MIFLPNGMGETTGDALASSNKPLQASGKVYYVHHTGSDAYTGLNRAQPFATIAAAYTAASAGDILCLLDGHTQQVSAVLIIAKALTIVAGGSSGGVPTVNFQATTGGAYSIFQITAAGTQIRNVKFKSSTVAHSAWRLEVIADSCAIVGCYFECGANESGGQSVLIGNAQANVLFKNCTFVSTATSAAATPASALDHNGTTTNLTLDGCVFDGGTVGFTGGIAYTEAGIPTRRRGENISLLRGADVSLHTSAAQSYWQVTTSTGDARMAT